MSWSDKCLCGFDVETTGINPREARIVTAAVTRVGGNFPIRIKAWRADPGVEIPRQTTAIHGITTQAARASGRPAGEVVAEVIEALINVVDAGMPLVVMNAPYDLTLLEAEAARYGLPSLYSARTPLVLDPRVLDKQVDRWRRGRRRLEDLCCTYGVLHGGAHQAGADAIAACEVTAAIAREYPELAALTLGELQEQQTEWAAGVRTEWPLIPAVVPEPDGQLR